MIKAGVMVNDLAIHDVGDSDVRPVRRLSPIYLPLTAYPARLPDPLGASQFRRAPWGAAPSA